MSRAASTSLVLALLALSAAVAMLAGAQTPSRSGTAEMAAAAGCDHYASPRGSNRARGTRSDPYRTAQRLARSLRPGQTGCLRRGTYRARGEEYVLRLTRGGRPGEPIRIRSHPGERARLLGIVMVVRGADRVRLSHLDFEGTGEQNTIKVYARRTFVEHSDITNRLRGDSCMILGSDYAGRARGTVVRGNRFHDCGATANDNQDHAIYASITRGVRIVDNVFSNSAGQTIQLYPDAQRSLVARNVIDGGPDTVRGGIVVGGGTGTASSGNVIARNVIAHAATYSVYSYWQGPIGSRNVVRENCTWDAGEADFLLGDGGITLRGNLPADPGFLDRERGDYRLAPDSACRAVVGPSVGLR